MPRTDESSLPGFTPLGPGRTIRVWPFFALVFLSWVVWIPAGARIAGKLPFFFPSEIAWLGVFAPLVLSVIFTLRAGGKPALIRHMKRFAHWRFPLRYWLFAILGVPFIAATLVLLYDGLYEPILADGLARLSDGTVMRKGVGRLAEANYESIGFFDWVDGTIGSGAMAFVVGMLVLGFFDGGLSEEPGWRGFAYPILRDRWGSLPAALVVGLVWTGWHLGPHQWAILFEGGTEAFLEFLPGHALTYLLGVTPLAIIFAWIYERSRASLLAVMVLHNSFNQTSLTLGSMFPDVPVILGVIIVLWTIVFAILATRGWKAFGSTPTGRVKPQRSKSVVHEPTDVASFADEPTRVDGYAGAR
jgi:membrane protease YdiL (CAAX protease family)